MIIYGLRHRQVGQLHQVERVEADMCVRQLFVSPCGMPGMGRRHFLDAFHDLSAKVRCCSTTALRCSTPSPPPQLAK
jgi:hypothetical protein